MSDTEFWFSAYIKHTDIQVLSEQQRIDELVRHFELAMFEESSDVRFSEQERAMTIAALRYWRRERLANSGHERDVETAFDHLQPLTDEEIDALCEHIGGRKRGQSGALKT